MILLLLLLLLIAKMIAKMMLFPRNQDYVTSSKVHCALDKHTDNVQWTYEQAWNHERARNHEQAWAPRSARPGPSTGQPSHSSLAGADPRAQNETQKLTSFYSSYGPFLLVPLPRKACGALATKHSVGGQLNPVLMILI